jgi:phosphoserine phosphatase RsbU/P
MTSLMDSSSHDHWKRVLHLGEELLNLDTITSQKEAILTTSRHIFDCQAEIWLDEKSNLVEIQEYTENLPPNKSSLSPLMLAALNQQKLIVGDGINYQLPLIKKTKKQSGTKKNGKGNFAAIPLVTKQQLLGVLQLGRPNGPFFDSLELDLLGGLATQSAMALQATRQISYDKRKVDLLNLFRMVSIQIADVLDPNELANRVTRLILETFHYHYVSVLTLDPEEGFLRHLASALPDEMARNPQDLAIVKLGQGIIGYVAESGEAIISNDVSLNRHYCKTETLTTIKSEAALPLSVDGRILGVLDVQSELENVFQETDVLVLHSLADNISIALENARLYHDAHRRVEHLAMVTEVTNAISSILDLDELLQKVVHLIHQRLGYPYIRIYTVHTGRRKIFSQVGYSVDGPLDKGELVYDLDQDNGVVAQVAREGRLINQQTDEISDISLSDRQSDLVIPLMFGDAILGVLEIRSRFPRLFTKDDQALLVALADYIAIAIRNANLYRSETWRRQVADSMREVAGLLTADAALDQVLNIILQELEHTLPCDVAAIWLADEAHLEDASNQLRLAAVHLTQDFQMTNATNENHLTPDEIFHILGQSPIQSPWLMDAISAAEPQTRHSDEPYEPLGAILDFPIDYSAIAAPMKLADQPLGLLVLAHHTNGRYGQESRSMTDTFASYAAVAIENTRLYEAAHDQAWVSTVLLQVSEATQSLNTLEELLATMVRITPMLIGVNSCSIFLWDNTMDVFTPVATYGINEAFVEEFLTWRVRLGENPAFDQIILNKNLVFIDDDNYSYPVFNIFSPQSTRLVLFPMIAHGEVLGSFLVDYNQETIQSRSGRLSEEVDWEEKFTIIQGIAHQTAFAVENIRLVKAQQDEAYVSVALLQVAQAVVSLNALDEILEAIVRITPILVGVRRSMIFLWDSTMKVFRLSQWYGVNRSELSLIGEEFTSDAFPILEAVRVSNSIIYHKCAEETDSPIDWNTIRSPSFNIIEQDFHNGFGRDKLNSGEDAYLGRDYLKSSDSLLLGFPLSVKGTVLGVMLTQEMEMTSGIPTRHIREKRLEISIGITQQAAMAIQNDQLQREVVERERLEREFQLARDIQQTFLPSTLPISEGWDLFSLWQPARQVSGDFFDIIERPNNRWGLLIADVADKGMPAALYMTLIRTLIRAAVNNDDSPASVLSRVNNLLVADSKSGMFVTIIYAVVSLDDGSLTYANAGHNPPLLLRSNGQMEKLHGTGMALGIFEDIDILEESLQLQPGDCLVCYTDGITEAFSPQDVMFGEERLIEIIKQYTPSKAQDLAENITRVVYDFMQDSTPSDDITMVILRRT